MTTSQANEFVLQNKTKVVQEFRLHYHGMPQFGWMNDPNGLVYYKGYFHIFYQHHPYDSIWGPMHWGHMISKDLVTFEHLPIALAPDQADETGCFSGGGVVDANNPELLHLLYTKHFDKDGIVIETQALASSFDGIHFEKKSDPIITSQMIQDYAKISDVRDPSIHYYNGKYYIIMGAMDKQNNGKFLIFTSVDLKTFEYHDQLQDDSLFGTMGECPDLSLVDGKHLFMYSVVNHRLHQSKIKNYSNFIIGEFDLENKIYNYLTCGSLDSGHHFYAPQSMVDEQGRTIIIGWMDMWGYPSTTHELGHHWFGALTFPRKVNIINNELYQYPVEELYNYRKVATAIQSIQNIKKQVDIEIKLTSNAFFLRFCNPLNTTEFFEIKYNDSIVSITGETIQMNPLCYKQSRKKYDEVSMRILVDTSSFEIFINQGIETFTSRVYIKGDSYQMNVFGNIDGIIHTIQLEE